MESSDEPLIVKASSEGTTENYSVGSFVGNLALNLDNDLDGSINGGMVKGLVDTCGLNEGVNERLNGGLDGGFDGGLDGGLGGGFSEGSVQVESRKSVNPIAIYWHEACIGHNIPHHPEKPGRLNFIMKTLRENFEDDSFRLAPLIADEQITPFHTPLHLKQFKKLCDLSEEAYRVWSQNEGMQGKKPSEDSELYQSIDGDTKVMWRTREAVYRAAGSVIAAIDTVFLPKDHPEYAR
jgi:hypothetical protein